MNLPNKLSLLRILLMPVFIFVYLADFIPLNKLIAVLIFIFATFTDMLDGYIARKYNLVTDLGKFLDPIADKLLATTGLLLLIVDGIIPNPFGVIFMFIMILRDYSVTGLRQIAQLKGVIIMADKVAKIKANSLYYTLIYGLTIAYLATIVNSTALNVLNIILYVMVAITTILIITSLVVYLVNNAKVFTMKNVKDKEKSK